MAEREASWGRDWAGLQIGGTLWILISAGVVLRSNALAAAGLLVCFALANVLAFASWRRLEDRGAARACRTCVLGLGVLGLCAAAILDRGDLEQEVGLPGELGAWMLYAAICIATLVLLRQFRVRSIPSGS